MKRKRGGRRARGRDGGAFARRVAEAFGAQLQQVRREKRWRQAAFAKAFGVSRTTVSNIERGKQRIFLDQVIRAAQILDVPVDALLPPLEVLEPDVIVHAAADDPLTRAAERTLTAVLRELSGTAQTHREE